MGLKICHNCGETVTGQIEKCPKCGTAPKLFSSPVIISLIIAVVLMLIIIVSLLLL